MAAAARKISARMFSVLQLYCSGTRCEDSYQIVCVGRHRKPTPCSGLPVELVFFSPSPVLAPWNARSGVRLAVLLQPALRTAATVSLRFVSLDMLHWHIFDDVRRHLTEGYNIGSCFRRQSGSSGGILVRSPGHLCQRTTKRGAKAGVYLAKGVILLTLRCPQFAGLQTSLPGSWVLILHARHALKGRQLRVDGASSRREKELRVPLVPGKVEVVQDVQLQTSRCDVHHLDVPAAAVCVHPTLKKTSLSWWDKIPR